MGDLAVSMSHNKTFQIKGELSAMMVLYLKGIDLKALEDELASQVKSSSQLFKGIPMIVDLSAIEIGNNLDLSWLKNLLLSKGLSPVGIRNVNEDLKAKAESAGWSLLESSVKPRISKEETEVEVKASAQAPEIIREEVIVKEAIATTMHAQQVRSGQQLTVSSGDLVVVNSVNEGAELLVDGNIHIYGALRGRALAGIHGDRSVRIFCQSLEAELVSIAGFYRMQENIPKELYGKMVQIYLDADELKIEPLMK